MRDIIAIAAVTLFTFPILYIAMLFATGSLRVEYGFKKEDPEKELKVEQVKHSARRDSLAAQNSKVFEAAQQERADLAKEQERFNEQYARLEILQSEIEKQREELVKERLQLENKMAAVPEIEEARFKKLAKIYEAMKPVEAAAILETLPDAQVASIISKMGDDRQKGRILSALTTEKAARLNKLIK
jgi:flagellar motility protein MotE (MotC chaperone)